MGNRNKPTHLRLVEGTRDKSRTAAQRAKEPMPAGALAEPPDWFDEEHAKAWRAAVASAPPGLLTKLDEEMMVGWVLALCLRRLAAQKRSQTDAMLVKSPNGTALPSPFIGIINRQTVIMKSLAVEMGFSPAARTRVSVEDGDDGPDPYLD